MNDSFRKRKAASLCPKVGFREAGLMAVIVSCLAFIVAMAYGWIVNAIVVVSLLISNPQSSDITVLFIARCIGILFPPLGSILGLFAG